MVASECSVNIQAATKAKGSLWNVAINIQTATKSKSVHALNDRGVAFMCVLCVACVACVVRV